MKARSSFYLLTALRVVVSISLSGQTYAENEPPKNFATAPLAPAATGLVWDSTVKEYHAQAGESAKLFTFDLANASEREITISAAEPSCGCTMVNLPRLPWKLLPGEKGRIGAKMDWSGRFGLFTKTIQISTSAGSETLTLKIEIPAPAEMIEIPLARARNLLRASADRQAVFKDDCARCHVTPAIGKLGKELYSAACGICHEAAHRATMVPDLKSLPHPTDAAFWRKWASHGKEGSLMPAFAEADGGPLTEQQIKSLVEYLVTATSSGSGIPAEDATSK